MRHQCRALVEAVGVELGDRAPRRRVRRGAPLAELRTVRHLVGQRMPEAVLDLGMHGFLVDELRTRERREGRGDVPLRALTHGSQHPLLELLPDDRGDLQSVLLAFGEPIDACREHGVHRRRDDHVPHRPDQAIRPLRSDEVSALAQRLDHFLDAEGIARCALAHEPGELDDGRIGAQQLLEQGAARLGDERFERQLSIG